MDIEREKWKKKKKLGDTVVRAQEETLLVKQHPLTNRNGKSSS